MSVLPCARKGCDNVMCDRYFNEYGYICNECFDELVRTGPETNIAEFFDTHKENSPVKKDESEIRYSSIFKENE